MKKLVTALQAKKIDKHTIENIGIPGVVLMERAAVATVHHIEKIASHKDNILCVCGVGNNGGDGIAIARILHQRGYQVAYTMIGNLEKATKDNEKQREIAKGLGVKEVNNNCYSEYTIIIDAIFGVGLTRDIEGNYKKCVEDINESPAKVIAVDIPSGIHSDIGSVMGCAVKADMTVTFGYEKIGTVLYPGTEYSGKVFIEEIGFDKQMEQEFQHIVYEWQDVKNRLPKRSEYSNKGTYGKVLVIAGSKNMAGACILSATAAYRVGAGLVKILTPEENRVIIQNALPEAVLVTYDADNLDETLVENAIVSATSIVFGPGVGRSETSKQILKILLDQSKVSTVIDADGIQLLAGMREYVVPFDGVKAKWKLGNQFILTPHLKELSDLLGKGVSVKELQKNIMSICDMVSENQNILVAKDARSLVLQKEKCYINLSGNDGMATAGSGDVLTGIIAGLLAQGMNDYEAACLGVYLHGLAGDEATKKLGAHSVMAMDIVNGISHVLKESYLNH